MCMQSSALVMLDTAEYFEQRQELDKAVLLYQKAGKERRALELCFSARLFDTLATIANNLTAKSDPAVMARCGEAYTAHLFNNMVSVALTLTAKPNPVVIAPCGE